MPDFPETFNRFDPTGEDTAWVRENWREFTPQQKKSLRWAGWSPAVYYTPTGKVRRTWEHSNTTMVFYRKLNGRWVRSKLSSSNFSSSRWWEKHLVHVFGNYYYFPELSVEHYYVSGVPYRLEVIVEFGEICPECGTEIVLRPPYSYRNSPIICNTCRQRAEAGVARIHNYSHKPFDTKFRKGELRFGVELELQPSIRTGARDKFLSDIRSKIGEDRVIFKRDGSIGDSGVELVTSPLLEKDIPAIADAIFEKAHLMHAGTACGMHVHISKDAITELQRGKIIAFLGNFKNREFLEEIAGREPNHFCNPLSDETGLTYGFTDGWREGWGKYSVYNISPNFTDEFRMFASTTDKQEFMERVEFVAALVKYCAPSATSYTLKEHKYYKNFVNWVTERRKLFPNFFSYLTTAEVV